MNSSQKKAFYYHADANALGGVLKHPVERVISTPGSISLAQAGGFSSSRAGKFDAEGLVSFEAAQVSVSGIEHAEGGWRTLATATVERLNILEVVTAERIVAQISVMHFPDDAPSEISFNGSQFTNLRVNGESISPVLDRRVLSGRPSEGQSPETSVKIVQRNGVPFSDLLWVAEEQFVAWKESGVEKLGPRFAMAGPEADLVRKGSALCSLVRGVEVEAPARAYCHVINIPDFGNIFLGEMRVKSVLRPTDDASRGDGQPGWWNSEWRHGVLQRKYLTVAVIGSFLLLALQGHSGLRADPDRLYRSIEQHFVSGELAEADAESPSTFGVSEGADPLWAARFRLQQAKVWVYQGRYRDALTLLQPPLPVGLNEPSLAIMRSTLLSIAYRRTSDLTHATQALMDAQRLCPNETACGEVRLAQGVVDVENDRLADAAQAFELSLASANDSGDGFLRWQSLLNLGVVSLRQEHYDDALDRFADASAVAQAIGAHLALEKATGNAGWALYKLGDYRRALANSQLAAEQAAALGVPVDQVRWLNDAGLSQYRLGDLGAARSSYAHSLPN